MANYSYAQLEQLWISAGGSSTLAPLMAAIALAESGGNPNATNPTDNGGTQTSWGLWQISNGTHAQPVANILNPQVNAQQAVAKYNSQGLGAWGTYVTGAYKKYMQGNVPPSGGNVPSSPSTTTSTTSSGGGLLGWIEQVAAGVGTGIADASPFAGLSDIAQALVALTQPFVKAGEAIDWFFQPNHWIRIGCLVGGSALTLMGIVTISRTGRAYSVADPLAGMSAGGVSLPNRFPAPGGQIAPAFGIAEVTVGAILLFSAFHNLPSTVTSFGGYMGYLAQEIQGGGTTG